MFLSNTGVRAELPASSTQPDAKGGRSPPCKSVEVVGLNRHLQPD